MYLPMRVLLKFLYAEKFQLLMNLRGDLPKIGDGLSSPRRILLMNVSILPIRTIRTQHRCKGGVSLNFTATSGARTSADDWAQSVIGRARGSMIPPFTRSMENTRFRWIPSARTPKIAGHFPLLHPCAPGMLMGVCYIRILVR